ncbi:MAG: murein L,D-transpeptidase catalytic domain family protein [Tannerella sp.]|jgi:hypothetical protein|nr:murein L,D-transpeptidase catalytic domain family protein [Tannerella sp.]
MQKFFLSLSLLLIPTNHLFVGGTEPVAEVSTGACELYHETGLSETVNYAAFLQAITGYSKIKERKKDLLTLIDFTKPSTEKRLYVIDVKNKKLLFTSYVAHGRNSGGNYATSFSNQSGSYKSSLGFYLTESVYQGKNGYSLLLTGLEKNINDKARERAIVMHGAPYANPAVIKSSGRLGRSLGCPALPEAVSKPIIDAIKEGSLLYIYANSPDYLALSTILPDLKTDHQKI